MKPQSDPDLSRSIRVFVSSTFRDMEEERNELMTHCWPELRKFCKERYVDFVEVDLRWGISEDQSKKAETLKLCLDEIHKCRPFFICMLGERYGNIPTDASYTDDLLEEQKWLQQIKDKSYTELEILHGVLNDPEMMSRSFFYFRDPAYSNERGEDFKCESPQLAKKLADLKTRIRGVHGIGKIHLKEDYESPGTLAKDILEDLQKAIEARFPLETVPDVLFREAMEHDSFAETRRKTYIGRQEYYDWLDKHCNEEGTPLVIAGASGSGKTALLANWVKDWREKHPDDFIFQHYIGGTNQSADHWSMMNRLMSEIKKWTDDPSELPKSHDDMLRDFGSWLVRLRLKAEQKKVRAILIVDALNQLEEKDFAHVLGWLPEYPFFGPLRMVVSTLDGPIMEVLRNRKWEALEVKSLQPQERQELINAYLKRFSKKLEEKYLDQIVSIPATENPLYLKIFLDELRVTGTHERLAEKISNYLSAPDIPALLDRILKRYEVDYEKERKGLVAETLGLICCARRGLSEAELLELLKPEDKPQLPQAIWSPWRSALDEFLVSKNGILNFAHGYIRDAVERKYVPDIDVKDEFQLRLADYFEKVEKDLRSSDELLWLLKETGSLERLRTSLVDIDRFTELGQVDVKALHSYWISLAEDNGIADSYNAVVENWRQNSTAEKFNLALGILGGYLAGYDHNMAAEKILTIVVSDQHFTNLDAHFGLLSALASVKYSLGKTDGAVLLSRKIAASAKMEAGSKVEIYWKSILNLANLLMAVEKNEGRNDFREGELLLEESLELASRQYGNESHWLVDILNSFTQLYMDRSDFTRAESIVNRAISIEKRSKGDTGENLPQLYNMLSAIKMKSNNHSVSIVLNQMSIEICRMHYGSHDPRFAESLHSLAISYLHVHSDLEAERLLSNALEIMFNFYGENSQQVCRILDQLQVIMSFTQRNTERVDLLRRMIRIQENINGKNHRNVAILLARLEKLGSPI